MVYIHQVSHVHNIHSNCIQITKCIRLDHLKNILYAIHQQQRIQQCKLLTKIINEFVFYPPIFRNFDNDINEETIGSYTYNIIHKNSLKT